MNTPYIVHNGPESTFERAYILRASGGRTYFFTGAVSRLTAKRKAAIVTYILTDQSRADWAEGRTIANLAAQFESNPFMQWDDVTLSDTTVTERATGDVTHSKSYTHSRGSGGFESAGFHHVIID